MAMVFSLKATPQRVGLACRAARRFFPSGGGRLRIVRVGGETACVVRQRLGRRRAFSERSSGVCFHDKTLEKQ
ncbi:hypothetical protein [uncultured Mailhella sp.]|uniref:hypothetical protein n=1 Tax=uncultured Mailhella sp. TaxID=1981031 RepID=UPI003207D2B1